MAKTKLEYIWLDGYTPTQSLRSKTKIVKDFDGTLDECPIWSFDGSSTEQATGHRSDCLLKPVALFPDPGRKNAYLVMSEVLSPDGTAHPSNGRATIEDDDRDFWFGFEQEYFLWNTSTNKPLGFPDHGLPCTARPLLLLRRRTQRLWPPYSRRAPGPVSGSGHQRRRYKLRSSYRPVGVPDVCEGRQRSRRPGLGSTLPA